MKNPERVVKRVLAAEGDRFEFENGNLYVDGELQKTSE